MARISASTGSWYESVTGSRARRQGYRGLPPSARSPRPAACASEIQTDSAPDALSLCRCCRCSCTTRSSPASRRQARSFRGRAAPARRPARNGRRIVGRVQNHPSYPGSGSARRADATPASDRPNVGVVDARLPAGIPCRVRSACCWQSAVGHDPTAHRALRCRSVPSRELARPKLASGRPRSPERGRSDPTSSTVHARSW